jgi:type I restriction enzyme, R subunit
MSMDNINFDEAKQSQLPAVELLINLGYKYLSRKEALELRGNDESKYLLGSVLRRNLMRLNSYNYSDTEYKFSEVDITRVVDELESVRVEGIIDTSRNITDTIMPKLGGTSIEVAHDGRTESRSIRYFDFDEYTNNEYHVTVEYKVTGRESIRCDIICFVNGIPLVHIENKKSSVGYKKAIAQLLRYQAPDQAPKLFIYEQLLLAMDGEHAVYGTTGTPEQFYATWREKDTQPDVINQSIADLISLPIKQDIYDNLLRDLNGATFGVQQMLARDIKPQDETIYGMLRRDRLLELLKHFVFYDGALKKVARYQQYFAIKRMIERVEQTEVTDTGNRHKGGIVWHTQGSGKSLTMVMFVRSLIENPNIINPRVLIVTDRIDLDGQIKKTFKNGGLKKKVIQMKSGADLLQHIQEKDTNVLTTLIHKFESAGRNKKDFTDYDDNIFVLIDEAHRTQGGDANLEMLRVMPNACVIAFTGTPLLKNDTSRQKFGSFIDKYTIDDALGDGVVLPLIYEGRYVAMKQDEDQVDRLTDRVSEDLSAVDKYKLQKRVEKDSIASNPSKVQEICADIEQHFTKRFQNTGLKGQLVAHDKYAALMMQQYFERRGKLQTALIISDENGEISEEEQKKQEVADYLKVIKSRYASLKSYEDIMIEDFKHNPEGVEILIVVDKLLTGFDAPCNTVLYLAKQLQDHNLLQAIARVNRLYENPNYPKTSGFIIDYSENAANIHSAMQLFGNFDPNDVKSALIDVDQKITELYQKYNVVTKIFEGVSESDHAYIEHLRDEPTRRIFKDIFNELMSVYDECMTLREFANKVNSDDLARYRRDLKKFAELKKNAQLLYGDQVDLKSYEREISRILDQYVTAEQAQVMTDEIEITDRIKLDAAIEQLGDTKSKAEAIAAQTSRRINDRMHEDEVLYEKFSQRIREILQAMHDKKMADIEALQQLRLIETEVDTKRDDSIPESIQKTVGADIFYRNASNILPILTGRNDYEQIVLELTNLIHSYARVDWWRNFEAKRQMRSHLDDYLYDEIKNKRNINISYDDIDRSINEIIELAENNHNTFGDNE